MIIWITGISGTGKTTLGKALFNKFKKKNNSTIYLDGDQIRKIFKNDLTIEESKRVLSNYGNVSSVSVLLVLKEILEKNYEGNFLMSALGPGFTAGLCKLKISKND